MATILCLRRRGATAALDPRLLWYVGGFAVERDGVRIGTVETALPSLDGAVASSLVLVLADGDTALLSADAVAGIRFGERLLVAAQEPARVDVPAAPDDRSDLRPATA